MPKPIKRSRKAIKARLKAEKEAAEEKRLLSLIDEDQRDKWEVYRGVLVEKRTRIDRIRARQEIEAWFEPVPLFRTVQALKNRLYNYFVTTPLQYKNGLTPIGLVHSVGGRKRWNYYKDKGGKWAAVLQTAENCMIWYYEKLLREGKNTTGIMFILKNEYGWRSGDPKHDNKAEEDKTFREQVAELMCTNFGVKPIEYMQKYTKKEPNKTNFTAVQK